MDREAAKEAIAAFLRAIDRPPEGELSETPELVAGAWCDELLCGYAEDPSAIIEAGSLANDRDTGLVTLRDLNVTTMCPHHLMPGHGTADIVYLPGDRLAGFGAIARALHALTRRLTLQEDAGANMAELLIDHLGARGAACRLKVLHTCLIARGTRERGTSIETLALRGSFADAGADRDLALGALR